MDILECTGLFCPWVGAAEDLDFSINSEGVCPDCGDTVVTASDNGDTPLW